MKSLEILDLYLKVAEEEMEEDKVKDAIKNNLNQIKQDLEVLEILKKYIYYKEHEIKLKPIRKSIYDFDYEKLKQWLEENKK